MEKNQVVQKKRGRPVGSKNKTIRKRPEQTIQPEPGENTKFLTHDLKLFRLPKPDMNNAAAVQDRIDLYFSICAEDDIKPSVASLALAFGLSRFTLFDLISGRNKSVTNPESILTLKKAHNIINSYYEHMMNTGRINPVSGIFLMKNNMGYQDTTTHVIQTSDNADPTTDDITDKAGLLE